MNEDTSKNTNTPHKRSFFDRINQWFNGDPKDRQELVDVIRDSEINDLIDHDTRDMLEGVMEMSEMRVRDIMIPRSQMITIESNYTLDQVIAVINDAQHSRYPVLTEDKDHVEGLLLAKDLLKYLGSNSGRFKLKEVIRPAIIIPESKRVDRLLKEFREERYHMSIVIDEFGGVSGLVTIEDILEQIVGEIEDEFDDDDENQDIRQLSKHTFAIKALTTIETFNQTFGTAFSDEEVTTIGGMIMTNFSHLPSRGETTEIEGYTFKVSAADKRRILQLQVTIPDNEQDGEED